MAEKKPDARRVTTPEFRVSFPSVFEARSYEGSKPKFSLVMLFKKSKGAQRVEDDEAMKPLRRAMVAAIKEKWGEDKAKWPKSLKKPFHDGDEKEDLEGYAGHWYVPASNQYRPGVVDRKRNPITKEDGAFYAGCFARADIRAFTYGGKGTPIAPGVSFSLDNVQKLRDGEAFSGGHSAEDAFDELEDDDSDADTSDGDDSEDFE